MKVRRQSIAYTEHRQSSRGAADHSVKYEKQFHKRLSNRRDRHLISRILADLDRQATLLDIPSGAGRLVDIYINACERLFELDASLEMLRLLQQKPPVQTANFPVGMGVASAFHLPFRNASFDTVVSLRLSHHIPDLDGRLWHIDELCRVARHHILVSFFDADSFKNRFRELRRRLGSPKRSKYTLERNSVRERAEAAGFSHHSFFALAPIVSGHSIALLSRA